MRPRTKKHQTEPEEKSKNRKIRNPRRRIPSPPQKTKKPNYGPV